MHQLQRLPVLRQLEARPQHLVPPHELPQRLGLPLSRLHVPDIDFEAKAGRVLDLYARQWEGKPLGANDFVISADEKTSIQARHRCHPTLPPAPRRTARVEHEYERKGALAYLAAWDCGQAKIFGRCETATGIEPFRRLVDQGATVYAGGRNAAELATYVVEKGKPLVVLAR